MNELLLMGSALYNKLNDGTVPVFYKIAPQGNVPPIILFDFISKTDDYTFNDKGAMAMVSIKVVSDRAFPAQAITLYGETHDLIQDSLGSVSGYETIRLRRDNEFQYSDGDQFWHVGGIYNFEIWQS